MTPLLPAMAQLFSIRPPTRPRRARRVTPPPGAKRDRSIRILARSLFRSLVEQGYEPRDAVSLATELIGEVNDHLAGDQNR